MPEFWKIVIPAVVTALGAYLVGRRGKFDDQRIKRGYELAEQITVLLQDIHEIYLGFEKMFHLDFGHLRSVEEGVAVFKRFRSSLYDEDDKRIAELHEKSHALNELLKTGALYLNHQVLDEILAYLKSGEIVYMTDGGLFTDTYHEEFFKNVLDEEARSQRELHYERAMDQIKSLVR